MYWTVKTTTQYKIKYTQDQIFSLKMHISDFMNVGRTRYPHLLDKIVTKDVIVCDGKPKKTK